MSTPYQADGFHTATPSLTIRGAAAAIDFYQRAFGATESYRMADPNGKVMHAEIKIGDSIIMLSDEFPDWGALSPQTIGGSASSLMLYVPDVDAVTKQAAAAGATVGCPPTDQFWGDRSSMLKDPFGHRWSIATHVEDVPPSELQERMKAWMAANG
jgi:PhnB protein